MRFTGPHLRALAAAVITAVAAYLLAVVEAPIPVP